MSSLLKKTRRAPPGVISAPEERIELPRTLVMHSVKFVEKVGSIASLAANLSNKIIDYTIPDGYAAELLAVGIMPDWHVATGASRLLDTEIGYDDKLTGIKFLTNHAGMNALPYGDRLSKQPLLALGTPMLNGSLTPKFNEGMKLQVVVTAGDTAVADTVRARAQILLYEESDCMSVFGVGLSKLATIIGGVEQSAPNRLFADYALLASATAGKGQWEDLYTKSIKDYEQVQISNMGIKPHSNSLDLKLYDLRAKKEFPEYDPYWTVAETYNSIPFGDDDDYQPIQRLPDIIAAYTYTNTDFSVKVKDNNAVIPASGMGVQLLGQYKRLS
jgi:hypothetical protein